MNFPFHGTPGEQRQQAADNYWEGADANYLRWQEMGYVVGRPIRDPYRKKEPVIMPEFLKASPPATETEDTPLK